MEAAQGDCTEACFILTQMTLLLLPADQMTKPPRLIVTGLIICADFVASYESQKLPKLTLKHFCLDLAQHQTVVGALMPIPTLLLQPLTGH